MNRYRLLAATIAALFVAGCASVAPQSAESSEPRSDKDYVTGSRIPMRDGSTSANVKAVDKKDAMDDIMQRRGVSSVPGPGGGM